MPAPRKIKSAKDLDTLINSFIQKCEAGECMPTDYELIKHLGIGQRTLERWWADTSKDTDNDNHNNDNHSKGCYGDVLKNLVAYRSHWCMMRGDTWSIFAAKQPHWGGWSDRPRDDKQPIKIDVTLSGAGGDWAK